MGLSCSRGTGKGASTSESARGQRFTKESGASEEQGETPL